MQTSTDGQALQEALLACPLATLAELEEAAIRNALDSLGGNRTHAAKSLGISLRTLQRKIILYGLPTLPPSQCRSSQNSGDVV